MLADDAALNDLADAVLEGRPFHWIAAQAGARDDTRPLIPHLRVVAGIAAMARSRSPAPSDAGLPDAELLAPGSTWGSLTVLELVGRGSFGDVYRAFDASLDRPVALKLLRRGRGLDGAAGGVNEGRLMARVRHPHVVAVHGADCRDGRVGLWMEFVDGRSLEEELGANGPLPEREVVAIGRDLCAALEAIHRAGLLHRDLKTQNVLRDRDGRVLVTDFGAGLEVRLGESKQELAGTPLYLAPEVLNGAAASARSDIYCVGVLMFHLLTASYPVTGRSLEEVWAAHRARRRQSLAGVRPDLTPRTVEIVERALAADPAVRYATAADMAAALTAPSSRPPGVHPRRLLSVAAGIAAAAVVAAIWWSSSQPSAPDRDPPLQLGRSLLPAGQIELPSLDGRAVPYIDTAERAQIWDVATRTSKPLIRDDTGVIADADAVISPDGLELAVASRREDDSWELRRLAVTGTSQRPLIARQSAYRPEPLDWARDGHQVLCWFRQRNGTVDLALVPVEDRPPRVVHTFTNADPSSARLSPDGRYAAAVITTRGQAPRTDLLLFNLQGGEPQLLAANLGEFTEPAWTPDGRHVLFLRPSATVAGSRDGWLVPVAGGAPVLAVPDLGNVSWVQLLDSGHLGRTVWNVSTEVYTRVIDLDGVSAPGQPTRIATQQVGNHVAPAWSPDGQLLALFRTRPADATSGVPLKSLTVKDAAGQFREVATPLAFLGGYTPEWEPGGRGLVLWGSDDGSDARLGYYRIDLEGGPARAVVIRGRAEAANAGFAANGSTLFYNDGDRGIVAHDVRSATEEVVVDGAPVGPFRVARDGSLAYTRPVLGADGRMTALVVQARGGEERELLRVRRPEQLRTQTWSPAGDAVLYTRASGDRPHELWVIPLSGAPARRLGVSFIRSGSSEPNGLTLNVDGATIAYPERVVQSELWITEWPPD